MSAVDRLFADLRAAGRKAFMPFLTAGDPDLAFTAEAIRTVAGAGASMLEIGLPYSDPIADGPIIQASYTRALDKKIKLADILSTISAVAPNVSTPLVVMTSYAIVYRKGPAAFLDQAIKSGLAGAIVPDLPLDESDELSKLCRERDFSLIQLVTPTTPKDRAVRIAERSSGFLYYVSIAGITGERRELPPSLIEDLGWLKARTQLPICVGFGVSTPDHARLLRDAADGVIVGSALVRRLSAVAECPRQEVLADVAEYVRGLAAALEPDAAAAPAR